MTESAEDASAFPLEDRSLDQELIERASLILKDSRRIGTTTAAKRRRMNKHDLRLRLIELQCWLPSFLFC